MVPPPDVELEAAKFLQKLIQESTDEPDRLATKLYVILQHMGASGKENSMPYQVISKAMETVINQHGLDIESLTSSRLPSSTGPQGDSSSSLAAGCSQTLPVTDCRPTMTENDIAKYHALVGPNSLGHDPFQGSISQRSGRSFDHESPSSIDTKSTNSHSQDRREPTSWEHQGAQKNPKASVKRKKSDSSALESPDDSNQQLGSQNNVPDSKNGRLSRELPGDFAGAAESWKQGFKSTTRFRETAVPSHFLSQNQANLSIANYISASRSDTGGIQMGSDRLQTANATHVIEAGAPRSSASRDTGKATANTNMPFKEHHLKQLRAQCLVFLAFRNGLAPKRLHLEIALGNIAAHEGTTKSLDGSQHELLSDKGKLPTTLESSCAFDAGLPLVNTVRVKNERAVIGPAATDHGPEANANFNETEFVKTVKGRMGVLDDPSPVDAEKHFPPGRGTFEAETQSREMSSMMSPAIHSYDSSLQPDGMNQGDSLLGTNQLTKPELSRWTEIAQNNYSRSVLPASIQPELGNGKDDSLHMSQHEVDALNPQHATSHKASQCIEGDNGAVDRTMSITDGSKIVPVFGSSYINRNPSPVGSELEEENKSVSTGLAPSPKQTLSEKWIVAHHKRKVVNEQNWVHKLQKADHRIACRFSELKETVNSSEDISTKTKSVIELKKLQLLEFQRRLRRNIMNDFFKPIQSEMEQLKSIKKHRIGRRMKHVEKYEQKMKEERQKRIRERQKEFFSEIELHKERLEDVFKYKRERCKGFIRHVKEFHKRKERIHREKIDRIQREKINLLKINDVEGYLRMVQDAKSDRVKQLLKETEKYLQKMASKLKEAKASAQEVDLDGNHIAAFDESNENATETEDETDQAKHYKESNEKYYKIAHSIKESIAEQPTGIQGGKLREYQMNGLRWLVSLYNNHLNGILADEMGLGKTVQVISLLCYLMEAKNDRGPFLVVVPSSVLPGWERELSFWAPGINKIIYAGSPEERRKLFKDSIVHQKFNVLLTTYEYLMNKHDRPKLSKIHWHYVIIDEGHRIKNASCKLNAELKHYRSSHRLLLTGTPLQNSLEELWALLNFLLPNIFNSSEDFSQWFNKPFEGNSDNSLDEALLSEEENLLIINRLHQVLRPFVLRRLKHKVENELPEKIERLVRCEASAYQKLLMTRVEENLGSLGMTKGRAIHNSVMELRNICNHPYLSHLHVEEVDNLIPKHFLPPIIRLCGKLEMLDRLLPKLKETGHRVLFFSTMTRLLDIMEDYLVWKQYRYLRLDGHTSGQDRGALIENFNKPDSPFFIFLLSIRAGGVGVNLQAADTVIIFDTDWNPQVDLQAQARAHRIGQKKDVLVLRLETVKSVEEQVRAAAEHKLGVANQSITAGFFDNNTSAEDRREYLESLLRESKKEEAAPVLDDDSLNDILARTEAEIEVFEAIDQKRREEEMATWKTLVVEHGGKGSDTLPPLPSRLVTDDDLQAFYEAMKIYDSPNVQATSCSRAKRKGGSVGGFDSQQYGRGKRAREVRSYEEQWSEEEFEKMCQSEHRENLILKEEKVNEPLPSESEQMQDQMLVKVEIPLQLQTTTTIVTAPAVTTTATITTTTSTPPLLVRKEATSSTKRGRGRPKRNSKNVPPVRGSSTLNTIGNSEPESPQNVSGSKDASEGNHQVDDGVSPISKVVPPPLLGDQFAQGSSSVATQPKRQGRKGQPCQSTVLGEPQTETIKRRGRKPSRNLPPMAAGSPVQDFKSVEQPSSGAFVSLNASILSADGPPALAPHATSPALKEASNVDGLAHSCNPPIQKSYDQTVMNAASDSSAVILGPRDTQQVNKAGVTPQREISISMSSADSRVLLVDKDTPLLKTGLHINNPQPVASCSDTQPSSIATKIDRKQNQKSQNVADAVRRRGRKRGSSASADPPVITFPLTPLSPSSAFVPGSSVEAAVSGSMGHVSVGFIPNNPNDAQPSPGLCRTNDILPDTGKTLETTPRRRGRKKSTVALAGLDHSVDQFSFSRHPNEQNVNLTESKVIATRSRQVKTPQSQNSRKATETKHIYPVEEMKQHGRAEDYPPVSSKGVTNVIVLALDAPSLEVDEELSAPPGFETSKPCLTSAEVKIPTGHNICGTSSSPYAKTGSVVLGLESASRITTPSIGCQTISEKGKHSDANLFKEPGQGTIVLAQPEGCSTILEASTDNIVPCQPEDSMLAPPGFCMPQRRISESVTVNTPVSDDQQASDAVDESAVNIRAEVNRGHGNPEHSAVNGMTASVPVSYDVAAPALESKDKQESHETGSDNTGHDISEAPLAEHDTAPVAVHVMESDIAASQTLQLKEKGGHVNTERVVDASTADPYNVVLIALGSGEHDDSHGPDDKDIDPRASGDPIDVCVAHNVSAEGLTSVLKDDGDNVGFDNAEQNIVETSAVFVANSYSEAASVMESKDHEESHDADNADQDAIGVSTASVASPFNAAGPALESNDQEKSYEPDDDDVGRDTRYTPFVVNVMDNDIAPDLNLELKEKEYLGSVNTEQHMVDASTSAVAGPCYEAASVLESKEQKVLHGPESGDSRLDTSKDPPSVCAVDSDPNAALTLELNKTEDDLGSENTDKTAANTSTSVEGPCDVAASPLESAEQKELNGGCSVDIKQDTCDTSPIVSAKDTDTIELQTSVVGLGSEDGTVDIDRCKSCDVLAISLVRNSDTAKVSDFAVTGPCHAKDSTLEPRYQRDSHGPEDNNVDVDARDVPSTSVVLKSDSLQSSDLALVEEATPGDDGSNVQCDAASFPSSVMAGNDATESLNLEPQMEGLFHGPENKNVDMVAPDVPSTSVVLHSESRKSSDLALEMEVETLGDHDDNVQCDVSSFPSSVMAGNDATASLNLDPQIEGLFHGPEDKNADMDTCDVPSASMVQNFDSVMALEVVEQTCGDNDRNVQYDAASFPSSIMSGNDATASLNLEPQMEGLFHDSVDDLAKNKAVSAVELKDMAGNDAAATSNAEPHAEELFHDLAPSDAISAVESENIAGDDPGATLNPESQVEELFGGSVVDLAKNNAVSAVELKDMVGNDTATVSNAEPQAEELFHDLAPSDAVTSVESKNMAANDLAAALNLEPQMEELFGDSVGDLAKNNAVSALELKDMRGSDASTSSNGELQAEELFHDLAPRDAVSAVESKNMAGNDPAAAVNPEPHVEELFGGVNDINVQHDAASFPSSIMSRNDASASLNLEPQLEGFVHDSVSDLAKNNVVSAVELKDMAGNDAAAASNAEPHAEELFHDLAPSDAISAVESENIEGDDPAATSNPESQVEQLFGDSVGDPAAALNPEPRAEELFGDSVGDDLAKNNIVSDVELKDMARNDAATVSNVEPHAEELFHDFAPSDAVSAVESKNMAGNDPAAALNPEPLLEELFGDSGGGITETNPVLAVESKDGEGNDTYLALNPETRAEEVFDDLAVRDAYSAVELKDMAGNDAAAALHPEPRAEELHDDSGSDLKEKDALFTDTVEDMAVNDADEALNPESLVDDLLHVGDIAESNAVSVVELKDNKQEPNDVNAGHDAGHNLATVSVGSGTSPESPSKSKEETS